MTAQLSSKTMTADRAIAVFGVSHGAPVHGALAGWARPEEPS